MREEIQNLLDIAPRTYYLWKKEGRPIIGFLEKYFTSHDLKEFLQTQSITKMEAINYFLYEQSESFFDFYKKIDGTSNAWRIFHLELASDKLRYDDVEDFSNNTLKSFTKFFSGIHNFFPYLKLVKELTSPTIWFVNMIKNGDQIMKQYITEKNNAQIAELYLTAFDLRTGLVLNNASINITIDDKSISNDAWLEARRLVLFGMEEIFDYEIPFMTFDLELITNIINKMMNHLGDEKYFHDFENF